MKSIGENTSATSQIRREQVGIYLQKVRVQKNLSLEDVTAVTKISMTNLRAIESMDFGKLPADTFVKGMLNAYAEFLGDDGRVIVEQFLRERHLGHEVPLDSSKRLSTYSLYPKKLAEPTHVSSATIAGLLLIAIFSSFVGFCFYFSWNPFAFFTSRLPGVTSSVVNAFHPADPATGNGMHKKALRVTVHFTKESKVFVLLDDSESIQQTYTGGTTVHWGAERKIQIQFSQPDCAEIRLNEAPISFPALANGHYLLQIPAQSTGS